MKVTLLCLPLSLAVGLVAVACSNPVDTSENVFPQDTSEPDDGEIGTCDCLEAGLWYRFDALGLTEIDGVEHPLLPLLNGLWETDIDALDLNIVMEVVAVDAAEVSVRIVNGARVDDTQTICTLDETVIETTFPRSGCLLEASSPSSFHVYAGTVDFPKNCSNQLAVKHAIPVGQARLEGRVRNDCGAILQGRVPAGVLGKADLGRVCSCLSSPPSDCAPLDPTHDPAGPCEGCNGNYQALDGFLQTDFTCETEDGAPAACVTATWRAALLDAAPASCTP